MKKVIPVCCLLALAWFAIGHASDHSTTSKAVSAQLPSLTGCWQLKNAPADAWVVQFDASASPNQYVGRYISPAAAIPPVNHFEAQVLKNEGGTVFVPMTFHGLTPGIGVGPPADYLATFSGRYDPDAIRGNWSFVRGANANGGGAGVSGSGEFTLTKTKCR